MSETGQFPTRYETVPEPPAPRATRLHAPLPPRRHHPSLLVMVDGTTSSSTALVWALREAARREARVLVVGVLDDPEDAEARAEVIASLRASLAAAARETGLCVRADVTVLDAVLAATLSGAARGGDLVLVDSGGKTLLRRPASRPVPRRQALGA